MSAAARVIWLGAAACSLVLGPWFGAAASAGPRPQTQPEVGTAKRPPLRTAAPERPASKGCGCDTIVVDAKNMLRDADIRTGDARVKNVSVTYVSTQYLAAMQNRVEVRVRQIARARSGDATGGQGISVDHPGHRCANILIRALNVLDDVEVRSGDAIAVNRSWVLLDPGIDPSQVEIDVEQVAEARAGDATAGQVVSARQHGPRGCGSVRVEETNQGKDVEVESGEAVAKNRSYVRTCLASGCVPELLIALARVDAVRLCRADGCSLVASADLLPLLAPVPTPLPSLVPVSPPPVAGGGVPRPDPPVIGKPTPSPAPTEPPPASGSPAPTQKPD